MKLHLSKIILLSAVFALAACDDIDEDARFSSEPVAFTPAKSVLIEDFTGQNCLNCPNAAQAVEALQALYGEEYVVSVAIHGGSLKLPFDYDNPAQLATAQGDEYNEHWGCEAWPIGMVDRGGLIEYTAWSAAAVARLQQAPEVEIAFDEVNYRESGRHLDVRVSWTANADLADAKINVWLVEDSIVGIQRMPEGNFNMSYVHNHVFRRAITEAYGNAISLSDGETGSDVFTEVLKDGWNEKHVRVVAFIETADGVANVAQTAIIKE